MTAVVSALIVALFSFATGFFVVLSYVEKPVWPLMIGNGTDVADESARRVHAELKRIIDIAPPTMATVVGSGTLLVGYQAWQDGFGLATVAVLGYLVVAMGYVVVRLRDRIDGVKSVPSDGEIDEVRRGLGRLAALHHQGLAAVGGVVLLQLALVVVA